MKLLGCIWGVGGVLILLLFAIYRLTPMAFALGDASMELKHWGILAFSISYMAYAEGIKGFHQGFAPRVVKRALYLKKNPRLSHVVFAPFFCMSYFYATRKRKISSLGLTGLIICFVILVRLLSQPWRGILDAGVVTGLTIGCGSIVYFLYLATIRGETISISADFPWEEKEF